MQGYIIDIKTVKDDDLIVSILTEHEFLTTYRFLWCKTLKYKHRL